MSKGPQALLERKSAIPINIPPTTNKRVMCSFKNKTASKVPTTGWAKNVSDAAPASNTAKAVFHRYIARAVEMMPMNKMPPAIPGLIFPKWCVANSQPLKGRQTGKPPIKAISVVDRTSVSRVTFRMRTEYSAQVKAAATRQTFPQKKEGERDEFPGLITATTPAVATTSANRRFRVIFSESKREANIKTKAGAAEVTSHPLAAVDRFVPTN